ncbi:MAG: hypothetical protein ABS98_07180 [Lysobacteraceae bacterium SCN 69-48]|nr:MAG: hypothetical protein ABS98_07180 [Xanthomonadaceae bacterium SCN 69-48]
MTIGNLLTAGCLLVLLGIFLMPFFAWDRKRTPKRGAEEDGWTPPQRHQEVVYRDSLELRPPYAPDYDPDHNWHNNSL